VEGGSLEDGSDGSTVATTTLLLAAIPGFARDDPPTALDTFTIAKVSLYGCGQYDGHH